MKKNIIEYDILRAFAVLLVVIGHCTYYKLNTDYGGTLLDIPNETCWATKLTNFITRVIYSFHMPLFIFLSGCLWRISVKERNSPSFSHIFHNKAKRLLVPFILTALFWSIPLKYISGYWSGNWEDVLYQIFVGQILMYGNSNSHLWFLQALFLIFIMSYFIEKFKLRNNAIRFMIILCILSMIGRYGENNYYRFLNIQSSLMYLFWFYLGFYFELNREKITDYITQNITWQTLIIMVIFYCLLVFTDIIFTTTYLSYYVLGLLGIIISFATCIKTLRIIPSKYLNNIIKISTNSYGIYLYSDPINYLIIGIVSHYSLYTILTTNVLSISVYIFRFLTTLFGALLVIKSISYLKNRFSF